MDWTDLAGATLLAIAIVAGAWLWIWFAATVAGWL